jgi:ubiquinone/menaquinone biosynthesis C-methylase UbiE
VAEICSRHGVQCSAVDFHAAVNVAFHRFESEHYDELHQDMWRSLPRQVHLLAEDCLGAGAPERIRMLDIGCGTGLATDSLLKTPLGASIENIDLLDTSAEMLSRAQARRQGWNKPGEAIEALVENLVGRKRYNLIITSSVLHHVPDLASFLNAVTALQQEEPSALFLHLQDPNRDSMDDPQLMQRMASSASARKAPEWFARLNPRRVVGRLLREIKGEQGQDYISKTNQELIRNGFLRSALTTAEIFAITDIHAREGEGISIHQMKALLPGYALLSTRSYGFFGALSSELTPAQQAEEERLIREKALNGFHVEAAWRRA